jgi:large subunit ribosomal protein L25
MELIAQKREKTGKAVKSLRFEGLLPAVIFGKGLESLNITINKNDFVRVYNEAGETTLIDVNIEGNGTEKVLVKEVTYHPVRDEITHVGFYKPNLKEKTSAYIPVEVLGEENNALIKSGEAVLITLYDEIEVEALPMDLPHKFEIDVATLSEIGSGITVDQLNYDKSKVEITDPEAGTMIIKLDYAVALETEEEVSEEEALSKIEATQEKKPEEGEEAASKE